MITEDKLEQLCLDWFRTGGYDYAYGPDIAFDGDRPERRDYQQTVLTGRLLAALQQINPHIPIETLEEAALAISKPQSPVLLHNNRAFHKLLLEGVPVEYREGDETRADHVQLIDFHNVENNQFLVVNQFTVQGTKQLRRPDLVVFINGLPIAVIAEGVADIFSLAGLEKPDIALLSDEFLEDVRNMKSRNLALELLEKLRNSASVDWQVRDSVRAKLRNLVRRTLRKWKYPPDKQDDAVELVLKQAEVLCEGWAS